MHSLGYTAKLPRELDSDPISRVQYLPPQGCCFCPTFNRISEQICMKLLNN